MPEIHTPKPDDVYESCDPRDAAAARVLGFDPPRIPITSYTPGHNRAEVVEAGTGRRPRSILLSSLHESSTTQAGLPRRTGYRLVQEAPDGD